MLRFLRSLNQSCWIVATLMLVQSVLCTPAGAMVPLILDDGLERIVLGRHMTFIEDPRAEFTHEEVLAAEASGRLRPVLDDSPSFGLTGSAFWFRLAIRNDDPLRDVWMLELADARVQYIDVYLTSADGRVTLKTGGGMRPYQFRDAPSSGHVFALNIPPGETVQLTVRVQSVFAVVAPLTLWSPAAFADASRASVIMVSLYIGLVISMLAYNGLLWLTLRDAGYGYYVGFLCSSFLTIGCFYGFFDELMPGIDLLWLNGCFLLSYMLLCFFALQFTRTLFGLSTGQSGWGALYRWNMFLCALIAAMAILGAWGPAVMLIPVCGAGSILLVLWSGLQALRQRNTVAVYFVSAWMLLLLGSCILVLYSTGVLPYNLVTKNAWVLGSSLEMILLSLALSARMRKLRDDHAAAQKQVIEQQSAAIEQQKRMVEQEKLASIGLLSAGVAHEINNPNNFVSVSAQTAESRIRELQQFVNELLSDDAGDDMKAEFRRRFDGILDQMKLVSEGSQRIAGIVKGMRSTSRRDDGKADLFDPVEGLLATLELVRPNFRQIADFDGSALQARGMVLGFASQMNQVFMNLLVNACHAIDEKRALTDRVESGAVKLGSSIRDGSLVISISDNGCGMSSEVQAKLFQPFFTTKGKDKGTGLGLGICRGIISDHDGQLEVESEPGVGTSFRIVLPLKQPAMLADAGSPSRQGPGS